MSSGVMSGRPEQIAVKCGIQNLEIFLLYLNSMLYPIPAKMVTSSNPVPKDSLSLRLENVLGG